MKIFISYHHLREQNIKDDLSKEIQKLNFFLNLLDLKNNTTLNTIKDKSIITEDIDDTNLPHNVIYKIIRENYLKDTNITIVLLGQHTKCRKFIDKEIQASLTRYGSLKRRKKHNALIILLTNDFIETASKDKKNLNINDFHSLITPENASQRIYENCINNYAVTDTVKNIELDSTKLIKLIEQSLLNTKSKEPNTKIPFIGDNAETCPGISENNNIINQANKEASHFHSIGKQSRLNCQRNYL